MKTALILAGLAGVSAAGSVETNLEITVEAERIAASSQPGSQLLKNVPGVFLREQGIGGAQADLSIRGSAFNTTGLVLNGLTLRNAQTEHWHADMPAPEAWFDSPRAITGLERFRLASGHPSGSVDLRLAPLLEDVHSVTVGGGDKELFFANALFTETTSLEHGGSAAASGFVSFDSDRQTDGYSDNNLLRFTGGGRVGAYGEKLEGDLLATGSWREFGARGFYGAASKYPAKEEMTDYLAAANLRSVENTEEPAQATVAWQRTHDIYWLDKHNHSFYENEHTSDTVSFHGNDRTFLREWFFLDTRGDLELETINSSALGDHTRWHGSAAALPGVKLGAFTLQAGGSWELFSAFSQKFLPAGGIAVEIAEGQSVELNYTESARQPSFTELNYESPDSLGNNGLGIQKTRAAELFWKGETARGRWRIGAFWEKGKGIVDWIRTAPNASWTAVNLAPIDTWGGTAEGWTRLSSGTEIGADALILSKRCDEDYYASRYALDYPDVNTGVSLRQDLNKMIAVFDDRLAAGRYNKGLYLKLREGVARYVANPVREHKDVEITSNLELSWKPHDELACNFGVVDLFDQSFQDYVGQDSCGRRWYVSVTWTW